MKDNYYIEQMAIVRRITSLANKLRQQCGIKLSQPILDVAYGGDAVKDYYLMPEFRVELCKAVNVID